MQKRLKDCVCVCAAPPPQIRHVMLSLELEGVSATPVFVPVYMFKTRVRGTVMRTYVAGGCVGGLVSVVVDGGPGGWVAGGTVGSGSELFGGGIIGSATSGGGT